MMSGFLSESLIEFGLCGHPDKLGLIKSVAARANASHSFLFHGPKNIGKFTCAKLLALSANCLAPADNLACFKCANCQKILNGRFEYLTVLNYKFGEIPIDDIRNRIISPCMLKVPGSIKSVYIINDARFFNSESANCFLKTLEEPTPNVIFILITSSIDSMLPTIRSRCQLVRFDEPDLNDAKKYARKINPEISEAGLDIIVGAAGSIGSIAAALSDKNIARDAEALMSFASKINTGLSAFDAAALIERAYGGEALKTAFGDFCSENVLQLEELFDKIEHVCLSKQYLRLMIVYSLLYLAKNASRRDYQATCHELSHRIDLFFQSIEAFAADYVSGFKNTMTAAQIKELTEKSKRETARNKRDEFLKIVSLTLGALEKIYVQKAVSKPGGPVASKTGALELIREKIAALHSHASLDGAIKTIAAGHYRDVAANINVELYLERYLMSVIEK
ncbi:MAG TPA: hypothetical protein PKW98_03935 [Candidatus Wallbacteria bacterium]|nr:hypothetical protein [Candidatus Wallbacteria bacterium]